MTDVIGKRAAASSAQAHAEAQAAQAEALMQGLNAFTNFEPGAHRWDVSLSITFSCCTLTDQTGRR
jgi:pyrimidine deaminase RibD-like protein